MTHLQKKFARKIETGKDFKTYILSPEKSDKVIRVQARNFYEAEISLFNQFGNIDFSLIKIL